MDKLTTVDGRAYPFGMKNVDTDIVIPAHWLKTISRAGLGKGAFEVLRKEPGNVFDDPEYAGSPILIAGDNFGCGSSREHAAWALGDLGIKVVIAPSFADIFYNNCFKNGLLPVVLTEQQVSGLFDELYREQGYQLTVDLTEQTVLMAGGRSYGFEIDEFRKQCLLQGLDEIGLTLKQAPAIKRYEEQRAERHPWVFGAIK